MKKILFLFLISFAFLSCSNNNQTADISFSFSRNILENQDTETELNISCKITGPSINQVKSQKITTQKEVFFSFEEIPVDTSVIVEVNVVDLDNNNIRLYSGSQTLTIKQGDNPLTVNLDKIKDGANLSIDGIQGIQFEFNKPDGSEVEGTTENNFSTTELEKGITATTTILTEENTEITNNLKYFYYLNGEKLNRNEENSNTIKIVPTDPLESGSNHLLVIVQYDNPSNPVYYSASLEFSVTESQE